MPTLYSEYSLLTEAILKLRYHETSKTSNFDSNDIALVKWYCTCSSALKHQFFSLAEFFPVEKP